MKIVCLNCKSAYAMAALRGDKAAVDKNARKVTARCPVCCDELAYTLHEVPADEQARDRLQVIILDDHLFPRTSLCARSKQDPTKTLMCIECPVYGALDKAFCDLAKQRFDLLTKQYTPLATDDEQEDEDEAVISEPTANDQFFMIEDGDDA